jgi:hypothetical protein
VGTATVSAIFLIVGGSMDVHANFLLTRAPRGRAADLRLAAGPTSFHLTLRF